MQDEFVRSWIIENALEEIPNYDPGVLTLRSLYYRLVARGMTNSNNHYQRVVGAMIKARRDGLVSYDTFSDHEREVVGSTWWYETNLQAEIDYGKRQVKAWMNNYKLNDWENQEVIPEVWIEKKALQGVFEQVTTKYKVALAPCKGYPSLTFLNDAADRFIERSDEGKENVILYFGDYDASGEDIPRSIQENLEQFGADVQVERIALMEHQVIEWDLPPAPTKSTDSRAKNWTGLGQVELDAVEPGKLKELCERAISEYWNDDLFLELEERQEEEREIYKRELKEYVNGL